MISLHRKRKEAKLIKEVNFALNESKDLSKISICLWHIVCLYRVVQFSAKSFRREVTLPPWTQTISNMVSVTAKTVKGLTKRSQWWLKAVEELKSKREKPTRGMDGQCWRRFNRIAFEGKLEKRQPDFFHVYLCQFLYKLLFIMLGNLPRLILTI